MAKVLEKKQATSASDNPVRREDLQMIAYQIFLERGMEDGHDLEDWFKAEEEIARRKTMASVA